MPDLRAVRRGVIEMLDGSLALPLDGRDEARTEGTKGRERREEADFVCFVLFCLNCTPKARDSSGSPVPLRGAGFGKRSGGQFRFDAQDLVVGVDVDDPVLHSRRFLPR